MRRLHLVILVLLVSAAPHSATALSLVGLEARAALPFPEEGYGGAVYLKEAEVSVTLEPSWRIIFGEPHHFGVLEFRARYVFENPSPLPETIQVTVATPGGNLSLDGEVIQQPFERLEYPSVYPGFSVLVRNFTLEMGSFSTRVLEVEGNAEGFVAGNEAEASYVYILSWAKRWPKAVERFDLTFEVVGGELVGSSPPSFQPGRWSFTDLTPSEDLIIQWRNTQLVPWHEMVISYWLQFVATPGFWIVALFPGVLIFVTTYKSKSLARSTLLLVLIALLASLLAASQWLRIEPRPSFEVMFPTYLPAFLLFLLPPFGLGLLWRRRKRSVQSVPESFA